MLESKVSEEPPPLRNHSYVQNPIPLILALSLVRFFCSAVIVVFLVWFLCCDVEMP